MTAARGEELLTLSPGAERDPLAREIRRRILESLERGRGRRGFERLWGTVVIVCKDDHAASGAIRVNPPRTTLTLRFDFGRLTIHEGRVGRPDVTLWGTSEELFSWSKVEGSEQFARGFGIDSLVDRMRALRSLVAPGKLRVFGRASHPRLVYRLARLLAGAPTPGF